MIIITIILFLLSLVTIVVGTAVVTFDSREEALSFGRDLAAGTVKTLGRDLLLLLNIIRAIVAILGLVILTAIGYVVTVLLPLLGRGIVIAAPHIGRALVKVGLGLAHTLNIIGIVTWTLLVWTVKGLVALCRVVVSTIILVTPYILRGLTIALKGVAVVILSTIAAVAVVIALVTQAFVTLFPHVVRLVVTILKGLRWTLKVVTVNTIVLVLLVVSLTVLGLGHLVRFIRVASPIVFDTTCQVIDTTVTILRTSIVVTIETVGRVTITLEGFILTTVSLLLVDRGSLAPSSRRLRLVTVSIVVVVMTVAGIASAQTPQTRETVSVTAYGMKGRRGLSVDEFRSMVQRLRASHREASVVYRTHKGNGRTLENFRVNHKHILPSIGGRVSELGSGPSLPRVLVIQHSRSIQVENKSRLNRAHQEISRLSDETARLQRENDDLRRQIKSLQESQGRLLRHRDAENSRLRRQVESLSVQLSQEKVARRSAEKNARDLGESLRRANSDRVSSHYSHSQTREEVRRLRTILGVILLTLLVLLLGWLLVSVRWSRLLLLGLGLSILPFYPPSLPSLPSLPTLTHTQFHGLVLLGICLGMLLVGVTVSVLVVMIDEWLSNDDHLPTFETVTEETTDTQNDVILTENTLVPTDVVSVSLWSVVNGHLCRVLVKVPVVTDFVTEYIAYWHRTSVLMDGCWWQVLPGCGSTWNIVCGYVMTSLYNGPTITSTVKELSTPVPIVDEYHHGRRDPRPEVQIVPSLWMVLTLPGTDGGMEPLTVSRGLPLTPSPGACVRPGSS